MHNNLSKGREVAAAFVMMLLLITLIASLLPEAAATTVTITIDPNKGHVGEIIQVTGEIETANGSYIIFFDEEWVKSGTTVDKAVNDTFVVPSRPRGDYNVTLHDETTKENGTDVFTVEIDYCIRAVVPSPPFQLQEGETTDIWVNVTGGEANSVYSANITVTDPSSEVYYNDTLQLTNTTTTGSGNAIITYPSNFSFGAHTNYPSIYNIAFNETLASGNFTVGLTNRLEYGRTETETEVHIQGAGYGPDELVSVNITFAGEPVVGYLTEATDEGLVPFLWRIPKNAVLGIYGVILSNETGVQIKPVPDIQNFTVTQIIVCCETRNKYDENPLADVTVEAYLDGARLVDHGKTNKTGFIDLRLDFGNYTFEALWEVEENQSVTVGSLENQSVTGNATLPPVECELAHLTIMIKDEAVFTLPFINVTLASNKTGVLQFETDFTGTIALNTFTNTTYTIEARRFGHLFNTTQIENLTVTRWINITCPTVTLFVNVLDSKGLPLRNVQVAVYEWSSERVTGPKNTDHLGNVSLDCTFGRYKIQVRNYSAELKRTVVLNETFIDLIEDQFFFVINCKISNLDLSVAVVDYFEQPIPNAKVKVEREFEEGYVNIANLTTGSDETPFLHKIGGDYRISVYIMGKLCETKTLHLEESKVIKFKIDKFVVVGGYPLEVTQLFAFISLGILAIFFGLALIYRRLRLRAVHEGEKKKVYNIRRPKP